MATNLGAEPENLPLVTDSTVEAVAQIERTAYESRSAMDHFAGTITRLAGTGPAILFHALWFAIWVVTNINIIPGLHPFDLFPFSLLTTIVSLEAIFLTLFVLVSQNRMSKEADKRARLDLQVNLLAEKEATMILRMLQDISTHLGIEARTRADLEDLVQETRLDDLARKLEDALPSE